MSLIPSFELGFRNAWIFILPIITMSVFGSIILGKRERGGGPSFTGKVKIVNILYFSIMLLSYVYSVFLPLKLGTSWFFAGLFLYLIDISIEILALSSFYTTPVDKPVTKGVYRFSRNPRYIARTLATIGIGIACLSWIFLAVAIVNALLLRYYVVAGEEPFLLQKYENAYRDYMNRTPRWI
ncbi:MAG: isoprenylcysteine carboxylmethyltransferase family protein [Candidatus Bathyarchaeia archaeon]